MKRLFAAVLLLAATSSVVAGLVELRSSIIYPWYHTPITIELYATDFYTNYPSDSIGFMDIAAITTNIGGTASNPSLHSALQDGTGGTSSVGDIVNSEDTLISDVRGYIEQGDLVGVYPFPAVLFSFELNVPDDPFYIMEIGISGLSLKNLGYNPISPAYTVVEPLVLYINVPEPATVLLFGLSGMFLRKRH